MSGRLSPDDPERLGGYWLAGRLGAGGQGVVYEAYDGEGRRVAIKVVHGGAASDPEQRNRFGKEAAAARRVASFCTARVIAAELGGDRPFIVSEYVEGPNLRRAVREGRAFAGDDLHRLGTAIATALAAVHEAGVVHRDLKPDNVLLGPDGPRVIDFGIARTLEMSLTSTGLVTGTPTYMAPELFTGERAGPPADVFAWGGVMLFAATGEDPFNAESLGGVMHRVLSVDPDLDVLPLSLRPLVAAALRKDPRDRPTAVDLLLALLSGGEGAGTSRLLERGSAAAARVGPAVAGDPALGTLAEDAYGMLSPAGRELAPAVFLRMVAIGPDGEPTGRPVPEEELPSGAEEVLRVFSYLLSRQGGEVRLARPALLGAWPRLRAWVADERDGLPVHAGMRAQARQWDEHGRRDGDVLQGSRLDAAVTWAATGRRHLTLNPLERDFLAASAALTRRRARRRRLLTVVLAALLAVSLAGGGLAAYQGGRIADQRDEITAQRDRAEGRELAFLAGGLRTTEPVTAMLLSLAAWRLSGGVEARSSLMSSLYQPETSVFTEPPVREVAYRALSRDGRLLVSASRSEIRLYDVRERRLAKRLSMPATPRTEVRDAALSPSGRLAAVSTNGELTVWDLRTGLRRGRLRVPGESVWTRSRFGDDESTLAVVDDDNEPYVWNFTTGRTYGRHRWTGAAPVVSATGGLAALTRVEGGLRAYRLPGGGEDPRFRAACPKDAGVAAFSPDGGTLACAGRTIRLVAAGTGTALPLHDDEDWPWPEGGGVLASGGGIGLRFSADGRSLLGFAGRSLTVWRVADQRQVFAYRAAGEVTDARFDADGRTVRYLLDDAVVSLDTRPRLAATGVGKNVFKVGLSPDARWMSAERTDSTPIRLWDVRRGRFAGSLPGTADSGVPAVFDARGLTMVTVTGRRLRLWDTGSLRRMWEYQVPAGFDVGGMAFTPDGATVAATLTRAIGPPEVRLLEWDARTGRLIRTLRPAADPGLIAFAPDGRTIATTAGRFLDAASGKQVGPAFNSSSYGDVIALGPALAPGSNPGARPEADPESGPGADPESGPEIGPGSGPGADPESGPEIGPGSGPGADPESGQASGPGSGPGADPESGQASGPESGPGSGPGGGPKSSQVSGSGGGRAGSPGIVQAGGLLAVTGGEGRVSLWDTRAAAPVPPVLHGVTQPIAAMAFSPAGDLLATAGEWGTVQLWDVRAKRRIGPPVELFGDAVMGLAFDPDGSALTVADQSGTLYRLPTGAEATAAAVCARAGRTLTPAEWSRHLPSLPYKNPCPR
ncbi:protein kinase domain-containing protein [Sphaerisporangium dianthi]|uniref:Protein kinase n=1 Tax=Sphaerisporangium dianthi TaxID=1436120 RepID=A0ABV9CHJ0_9ACTN